MKQIISRLRSIGYRRVITLFLATVTFLVAPVFNHNSLTQAQAATVNTRLDARPVDPEVDSSTIKRIQEKAEDLGDSPERRIGDTGLENIKQLGEKIPKVIDLNVRQQGAKYNPNESNKVEAMEKAQEKVDK